MCSLWVGCGGPEGGLAGLGRKASLEEGGWKLGVPSPGSLAAPTYAWSIPHLLYLSLLGPKSPSRNYLASQASSLSIYPSSFPPAVPHSAACPSTLTPTLPCLCYLQTNTSKMRAVFIHSYKPRLPASASFQLPYLFHDFIKSNPCALIFLGIQVASQK